MLIRLIAILVCLTMPVAVLIPPSSPPLADPITAAQSPAEAMAIRRRLFDHATDSDLEAFVADGSPSVAIASAWERARTFEFQGVGARIDPSAANRFVDVVESRLRCTAPAWWRQTVLSSHNYGSDAIGFDVPGAETIYARQKSFPWPGFNTLNRVTISMKIEVELRQVGEHVVVSSGRHSVLAPLATMKDAFGEQSHELLDVYFGGRRCFLAAHSPSGFRWQLYCLDSRCDCVLWQTEVWAADCQRLIGYSYQRVSIVAAGANVVVFGGEPNSAFVEAFDRVSGKPVVRFATFYYER